MPIRNTRIQRLLKLLTLVQSGPGWGPRQLAEACGVTVRTIHRDMDELKAIGVPWIFDTSISGYTIPRGFFLPPLHLTLEEVLALAVLCDGAPERDRVSIVRPAWRALAKIRSQLPESALKELDEMDRRVAVQAVKGLPPGAPLDAYDRVQAAISERTRLRCRTDPASADGVGWFRFDPLALFFSVRAWHVVGRRHTDAGAEICCLPLSRLKDIEPTHVVFELPEAFSLQSHLGNAWRLNRGDSEFAVELWIDAELASLIGQTRWHRTQHVEFHADGSATFRCTVAGLDEIVWWVLSMGPHCRVRHPEELAQRVREAARALIRAHAPGESSDAPSGPGQTAPTPGGSAGAGLAGAGSHDGQASRMGADA